MHRHDGEGGVRRRWRGDVNSIHIGEEYQQPEEAVDARKMRNLAIAANTYVKEQKVEKELRFDIVTVVGVYG